LFFVGIAKIMVFKLSVTKFLFFFGLLLLPIFPLAAQVQEESDVVQVVLGTPPTASIIDKQSEKGDITEYTVKIKNNLGGKASIYTLIYDINSDGTLKQYNDPSELDDATSITRWVEFRRAVIEVEMGQEATQVLKIKPSINALSGTYHAVMILGQGSTRTGAAETAEKFNEAKIFLNWTIKDHTVERAEIAEFRPLKPVLTRSPLGFSLKIKNIGNTAVVPSGEVVLYTKNGKELSSAAISGSSIASGETKSFPVNIKFNGGPGRYKAKLIGEYGETSKDLQDVIYFLYLPTVLLSIIIILILAGLVWLTIIINKRRGVLAGGVQAKPEIKNYVINLRK
jgi:hypothetical protein